MKLTTSILLFAMTTGAAWAQNPDVIENTKNTLNNVAKKQELDRNAVLNAGQSKPAAGTAAKPATAPKTAAIAAKPSASTSKPAQPAPKPATVAVKPATPAAKPANVAAKPAVAVLKPAAQAPSQPDAKKQAPTKIAIAPIAPQPKQGAQKVGAVPHKTEKKTAKAVAPVAAPTTKDTKEAKNDSGGKQGEKTDGEPAAEAPKEKKMITAEGRRDPFVNPVVSRISGPACSTGKRCLAIDQIAVRGVVKSDGGMIAVVVNSLNKAYFLKENDPVYNGYVLRITGDSVIFKETYQDRLGKELQREVVKKITTPAV